MNGVRAGSAQPKYMTIFPPLDWKRERSTSVASMSRAVELIFSTSVSKLNLERSNCGSGFENAIYLRKLSPNCASSERPVCETVQGSHPLLIPFGPIDWISAPGG